MAYAFYVCVIRDQVFVEDLFEVFRVKIWISQGPARIDDTSIDIASLMVFKSLRIMSNKCMLLTMLVDEY